MAHAALAVAVDLLHQGGRKRHLGLGLAGGLHVCQAQGVQLHDARDAAGDVLVSLHDGGEVLHADQEHHGAGHVRNITDGLQLGSALHVSQVVGFINDEGLHGLRQVLGNAVLDVLGRTAYRHPKLGGDVFQHGAWAPHLLGADEHMAVLAGPALSHLRLADTELALDQHQTGLAGAPARNDLLGLLEQPEVGGLHESFFHLTFPFVWVSSINSGTLCDGCRRHRALLKPDRLSASSQPRPRAA